MALRMTFSTARRSSSGSPCSVTGSGEVKRRWQPRAAASMAESSTIWRTSSSKRMGLRRRAPGAPSASVLADEFVEADRVAAQGGGVAFGAGDFQKLADEGVEAVGLLLNAVECGIQIVAGASQLHGNAQAGERRAELVRDIEEQAALGGKKGLDAAGHAVEGAGPVAQLIAAGGSGARGEIAAAEAF